MVQIEFVDGNLNYVDDCRLDGRLDYHRFTHVFENLVGALMLNKDDFFILFQVKQDLSNDDDCNYDFVRIVFRSFGYPDSHVSYIAQCLLLSFRLTL